MKLIAVLPGHAADDAALERAEPGRGTCLGLPASCMRVLQQGPTGRRLCPISAGEHGGACRGNSRLVDLNAVAGGDADAAHYAVEGAQSV